MTVARGGASPRIDEADEATARAALEAVGDGAPAGKLALRLAGLAHHRGDRHRGTGADRVDAPRLA
jgi:hypothetical protein